MKSEKPGRKLIATNRRASFDYEIVERFEAGIALLGPEVKALRAGKASLAEAYAQIRRGEVVLMNLHIPPYAPATRENPDPRRERTLLLHRAEIDRLAGKVRERGFTLVPLQLYFSGGRVKVEIALARGKRRYDRRETLRKRESEREMARSARGRGRIRS